MANKFVARKGLIALNDSSISGSLSISGSVSASIYYGDGRQLILNSGIVSSSEQLALDISGAFTEISGGFDGRLTNLESFSSSLDTTFATELEVSGYVEQISTSFETRVTTISTSFDTTTTLLDGRVNLLELTASDHTNRVDFLEITGSNHEVRIDSLESFSSSLDATYATEAELNTSTESVLNDYGLFSSSVQVDITQTTGYTEFSNSIDVTTDALDGRVTDLETFSASIDTIFSTESEVSGYVESVSTSFDTTIDNLSSSLDGRLDVLEGTFSTSVDTRLDDLESFSSSLDTTFATEAELNTATESVLNDYNLISQSHQDVSLSGSFSGSFYGDGSNLTGVTSYTDTDTLDYINELGVLSGSNQNLTGSFTGSFIGDGSGLVDIISASYAQTASYALNAGAGAGFPFSGSAVITGSLFVSGGAISGSFIGDGSGLTNIPISALTGSFNLVAFENTSSVIINHELNTTYPLVQVYDNTNSQIIPESVTIIDSDTIQIDFATNRSGHVMLGSGGDLIEVIRDFPTYLTVTASFSDSTSEVVTHNLGTKNVIVQVYDGGNNQILPQNINVTNENNVTITFSTNESGYVVVSKAGHLVTGSLLYENILNLPTLISSSEQIASDISGAFTEVSSSLDFRLDNLEDFSTSLDDTFATDLELGQATESILANYGIVSGSSQISYPNISNIPAGIISGAAQLAGETIPGNLTVGGVLTAQEFHTQFVSASIIYQSGSTQFGNSADDTHIFSGSLNISGGLSVNNLNYPISDNGEFSFIQTDGNGNLSLQYVNTIYETIVNGETFQIPKGSPLYASGSQGAESIVYLADAGDATKMPVTYVAADNIDSGASGRGIVLGLITGVDTTGYAPGTEIYVGVGGGWTATRPSGSAIAQLLGIVTKEGNGGQGLVLNPGPYNIPNLESGQIFWADANDNVVKKPLADILSGSNYVYSGSFSGSFVGDGSQLSGVTSYTDTDVLSYLASGISGSILPSTTDTYDLGSPTNRWKDLYLSGSTLYLGETKLSRNTDGDLEIKDSQNNRKNLIAESIQLVRGNHHIQLAIDDSGRFKQTNATNDAEVTNLGSFSGSFTGSFIGDGSNLSGVTSYTDADTLSYINTLGVVSSSAQISITESQISDLTHYTNSDTLSYINSIGVVSGSVNWDTLSGRPSGIISSSAQLSNATIPGNFTVGGILTAQEFHTEFVSASIIYNSGSTQFGDTIDDTHTFTGTLSATTIQNVISSSAQVDYNSIQNQPTIPTNNNQLTNGAGYTTCVGDITGVTAGTGLSGGGTTGDVSLAVDLSELTDMTATMAGTDEFIVLDGGEDRRKAANEIGLSIFNNDSSFTSCTGTVTSVGGTGTVNGLTLTGTVTSTGNLTLGGTLGSITVSQLDGAAVQTSAEGFSDSDTVLMTAAAIEDRITGKGYTTCVGDITGVTAGTGITGGGTSGTVTINHSDTSTLNGAYGTNGVSSITVDSLGHVTAVSTATYCTTDTTYSAATMLTCIKTVDGTSSGLDADLLDGYHASTTRDSPNTIPIRDEYGYLQVGWINTTSGATTSTIDKIYASNDNYIRYITPATLISQLGIWTSGNDGAGSGLDADLLDGLQASNFLRSDTNSTFTGTLTVNGGVKSTNQISVNNRRAISVAHWSAPGTTTGAIKIQIPGTHSSNWSMLVLRITAYEYNSTAATIYYVSGHDWTSGWYNNGVIKIGNGDKNVSLGYDSNYDYVIVGETSSSWSYGHVTVDVMSNPSFYNDYMDITTGWLISQDTSLSGVTIQSVTNKRVLTTSDVGTGNGLDADLLDGNHASAFYLATNPSGYTTCTGTQTGTGTSGYISKWNGTSSQTNSLIYDNGTNVGIGTTSPGSKLQVEGTNPFIRVSNTSGDDHGIKISYGSNDAHGLHLLYNVNGALSYIDNTYQAVSGQVYGDIYIRQNVGGTMTPRITIKADGGNVGIGTTTPENKLDVAGGAVIGATYSGTNTAPTNGLLVEGNVLVGTTNADVGGSVTGINLSYNGRVLSSNNLTGISSAPFYSDRRGENNTGPALTLAMGGYLKADIGIDGTNAITDDASITFNTISNNNTRSERMRITSSGNVGIGTTSPSNKLDVSGAVKIDIDGTYGGSYATIGFGGTTNGYNRIFGNTSPGDGLFLASATGRSIFFRANGGSIDHMTVASDGNVGIGTTSPSNKLDVAGSTAATTGFNIPSTNLTTSNYGYSNYWSNGSISYNTQYRLYGPSASGTAFGESLASKAVLTSSSATLMIGSQGFGTSMILGTSGNEAIRIDSSGNVGIGTTSPTGLLHLRSANPFLVFEDTDDVNGSTGRITAFQDGNFYYDANLNNTSTPGGHVFRADGNTKYLMIIENSGTIRPGVNGTQNLGASSYRWNTVYTSDLSLKNDVGDWTIVEGEEDLFIYNNKKDKVYKFNLTEVDKDSAPKKRS